MDDAEAEAVLVALGDAALSWSKTNMLLQAGTKDGTEYAVLFHTLRGKWCYVRWEPGSSKHEQQGFADTEAAAKAACERHHSTGKWES